MQGVHFHHLSKSRYFPNRTLLKKFILSIFKREGYTVNTVNYIFCSDEYLYNLNKHYLSHDTYTDVITFYYSRSPEAVVADIFISLDRIKENAQAYRVPYLIELYRVIFHGALHLCGYKDKTKKDALLMRSKEDFYLKRYVSRGTPLPKS